MFRKFTKAFFEEIDYLSNTFAWILRNLTSWRGIKLIFWVLWANFLAVLIVSYRAVVWFFKALLNHKLRWKVIRDIIVVSIILFLIIGGGFLLWASTLQIPDLNSFDHRLISQSTQIYDRTGNILLYDLGHEVRRTVVPYDQISQNIKNATVAIEDAEFYQHGGIKPTSIIRAIWVNITHLGLNQGGSTITQQVIKNSLLTNNKSITRKIKEWILAIKLEQHADKNTILNLYLNLVPYGGNIYGIEEASQAYFGKHSIDLTLAESAYLAAMTQAPSYYSPYGAHKEALDTRKNLVLKKMLENKFITEAEYEGALAEQIIFVSQPVNSIKAPHFSMFIEQYLEDKYGADVVATDGLKVVTTLDYTMQQKAEDILGKYVKDHAKDFKASNGALVAIDPRNGQILTMVGSRDYFDKDIDGNFNVATAHRQPGSSFKPFVYSTAFDKGYTPDTIAFDVNTEFSVNCSADSVPNFPGAVCYNPQNYEGGYQGAMTFRKALGNSRNIPGVEVMYLAGVKASLDTAHAMGIQSLNESPDHYGLTLVLGGGEVSPLDMAEAYSVFANNGAKNPETGILKVTDRDGKVLEEFATSTTQAIPEQSALLINDILSDTGARTQIFPPSYFGQTKVAMKTGTTNDSRDAWVIGYTPDISVSAWMGNNDNSPMVQKASALIVAPMWKQFMDEILPDYSSDDFKQPEAIDESTLKPILRGVWQGGASYSIDKSTGQLATDLTPVELRQDVFNYNIHSILYWLDKDDPLGPAPEHPENDPQFDHWEEAVRRWAIGQGYSPQTGSSTAPTVSDTIHTSQTAPRISITLPASNATYPKASPLTINIGNQSIFPLSKVDYFVNGAYIGSSDKSPFSFTFIPGFVSNIRRDNNELRAEAYDNVLNKGEALVNFNIGQ